MTFEYRDADGGHLSVSPLPGVPYVLVRTDPEGCAVPADLVPDMVAGIRDAARTASSPSGIRGLLQHVGIDTTGRDITIDGKVVDPAARTASGQTDGVKRSPDATVDPTMCPRCKGDNQEAFELCGNCTASGQQPAAVEETHVVTDDTDDPEHVDNCPGCWAFSLTGHVAVPAVGQPAEAQATEARPSRVQWPAEVDDASRTRQLILNCLTGRAVCGVPRPVDEATGLLDAFRAAVLREAADAIEQAAGDMTRFRGSQIAAELRRMAEEART